MSSPGYGAFVALPDRFVGGCDLRIILPIRLVNLLLFMRYIPAWWLLLVGGGGVSSRWNPTKSNAHITVVPMVFTTARLLPTIVTYTCASPKVTIFNVTLLQLCCKSPAKFRNSTTPSASSHFVYFCGPVIRFGCVALGWNRPKHK